MPENAFDRFIDASTTTALERQQRSGSRRNTLRYPLTNEDKYLGQLSFQVVDESQHRVDLSEDFVNLFGNAASFGKGFASEIAGALGDALNKSLGYSFGLSSFKGTDKQSIRPNVTNESFAPASDFSKISLYLPQAINIQDAVSYDNNIQLGRIGAGVEAGISSGNAAGDVMEGMGMASAESIAAIFGGAISKEAASTISQNLAKRYGTEGAGNAIALATQTTLNPNTRTLFQSVPIRQFSFSFSLIATSPDEAKVIEEIIKAFRTELYPEKIVAAGIDYAYRFPRRFLIKAAYNNREWPGIKFLPCYLQNFQAVYNPNSMGFHRDGEWSEVQITMSFSESRALSKQDIQRHYQGL